MAAPRYAPAPAVDSVRGYSSPDVVPAGWDRPSVRVQGGESVDDALRGCAAIALRRASLFGRAPVMADLRIALTVWGFFDDLPPTELVSARKVLFEGLRHGGHHYAEARNLVDMIPEATLRMTPEQVSAAMPGAWRALTGV